MKTYLLSLSFTLLLLGLILYLVPFRELIILFRGIAPSSLLLAFLLYSLSQVVRAYRWKLLLKGLGFVQVFLINSAHIMLNNIFPARTGELSWFYYAKRLGVNFKLSMWYFLLGRLYDLLSLLFLLLFSLSLVELSFFMPTLALFLTLPLMHGAHKFLPKAGKLGELKSFLKRELTLGLSLNLLLLSLLSQISKFLSFLILLNLWHEDLYRTFLAFSGGELSSVLPIHSFMGLGTYEFAFGLPLKLLGESLKEWLKLGFVFHSFLLFSSLLWGIPSVLLLSRR
ncbi:MAG: hypothetical protein D6674_03310 [Acidobacteria bacterium]|nr:MAG: hypothetical protein D6674_03310 [Acidobacteriota bacterium]